MWQYLTLIVARNKHALTLRGACHESTCIWWGISSRWHRQSAARAPAFGCARWQGERADYQGEHVNRQGLNFFLQRKKSAVEDDNYHVDIWGSFLGTSIPVFRFNNVLQPNTNQRMDWSSPNIKDGSGTLSSKLKKWDQHNLCFLAIHRMGCDWNRKKHEISEKKRDRGRKKKQQKSEHAGSRTEKEKKSERAVRVWLVAEPVALIFAYHSVPIVSRYDFLF